MKKQLYRSLFLFSSLLLFSAMLSAQGSWTKKPDYNLSARTAAVGFVIGTGGYIGTGFDNNSFRRNFSVYNQAVDTWTQTESYAGATGSGLGRNVASAFVIGTKAYVGLGQGSNPYYGDFWEFDVATDTWTQKANFGGTARRSAASFAANNNGYVVCGQDISGFKNDLWMYDATANTWTQKLSFPGTARRLPVAFVIGNKAYVGTGDDGTFKNDFFEYDAVGNTWAAIAPFGGSPRYATVAFAIGTDGYVGTGYDNTLSNKKDFWKYTPATNTWSAIQDFGGTARSNAVAFSIGDFGYVATGYDTLPANDVWMYDPNPIGIRETDKLKTQASIYPNPMKTNAVIAFHSGATDAFDKIAFLLYDINGREVKNMDLSGSSEHSINREGLTNGLYIYKFLSGNHTLASGKLMVQ